METVRFGAIYAIRQRYLPVKDYSETQGPMSTTPPPEVKAVIDKIKSRAWWRKLPVAFVPQTLIDFMDPHNRMQKDVWYVITEKKDVDAFKQSHNTHLALQDKWLTQPVFTPGLQKLLQKFRAGGDLRNDERLKLNQGFIAEAYRSRRFPGISTEWGDFLRRMRALLETSVPPATLLAKMKARKFDVVTGQMKD